MNEQCRGMDTICTETLRSCGPGLNIRIDVQRRQYMRRMLGSLSIDENATRDDCSGVLLTLSEHIE